MSEAVEPVETPDPAAPEGEAPAATELHAVPEVDPLEARFKKIEVEFRRVWIRNLDFRNKIFAIQHAVVEELGLTHCEIGHPAAEIFPVEMRREPDAPVRVLVFGSMGANMGMAPKQFFNSFKRKHCEILFFKDFRQCWYQQGLLGLTKDVPSTADYIRTLLGDDPRPISIVGASSGGFAAILFGALLGAKKVVAFSPQSLVTERAFDRFKTDDTTLEDLNLGSEFGDLHQVLTKHPLQGTADIYFSRRAPYDASEAQRLEGLPGVQLHPLEWNGHNTAVMLRNTGRLDDIIDHLATP